MSTIYAYNGDTVLPSLGAAAVSNTTYKVFIFFKNREDEIK